VKLSVLISFFSFFTRNGWITSSIAVYHSTIFCYKNLLERCNTLIPDALPDETTEVRWESNRGRESKSDSHLHYGGYNKRGLAKYINKRCGLARKGHGNSVIEPWH